MYYIQQLINIFLYKLSTIYTKFVFKLKGVKFRSNLSVSGKVYMLKRTDSSFTLGENVRINSGYRINPFGGEGKMLFILGKKAKLLIGNNVGISNSSIHCYKEITIENDVIIGGGVKIFDTDFHSINFKDRLDRPDMNIMKAAICIKKGAFIGGYSIIGKGITIGERTVIGAGSVVTQDIPNDEIWAGNPAKFIKKIV